MMNEFLERQMEVASIAGEKSDAAAAEEALRMGQGQTPTADPSVYEAKPLRDNGYALSNPTMEPNRYTKPNARFYAGRDSSDGKPIIPVTQMPKHQLPHTSIYNERVSPTFDRLSNARNSFDVENNLSKVFQEVIGYTNALADVDPEIAGKQANRVKYATSDKLEQLGFDHIFQSERNDEGVDDSGLNGLQMVMSAHIMRGATDLSEVTDLIGDTGANEEQIEETWDKAMQAYARGGLNVQQILPSNKEQAMEDHRYLGAAALVNDAMMEHSGSAASKGMSAEDLYDSGMFNIDMLKSNELLLADVVMKAKDDPELANAVNFLLDSDDQMDTTMGDVGRGLYGMALSPSTYVGLGIASKFATSASKGFAVREALKKFATVGAEGAILSGAYGGLTDYGYQNLDIQSGKQEEYDPVRGAVTTGTFAGIGFGLGGIIGLAPDAARALTGVYKRFKEPTAAQEFANAEIVPEAEMVLRRNLKKFLEEDEVRKIADDAEAQQKIVEWSEDLAKLEEERKFKVIKGGATEVDPDHAAALSVIDNSADPNDIAAAQRIIDDFDGMSNRIDDRTKYQKEIDDELVQLSENTDADKIKRMKGYDSDESRQEIMDASPEMKRLWENRPQLKVVADNKTDADLVLLAESRDPNMVSNMMRQAEGKEPVAPKHKLINLEKPYNKDLPDFERKAIARNLYRDELREAAKDLEVADIQQLYQDRIELPMFEFFSGINAKERMTKPEVKFFHEIFNNKQDLLELLDEVPSAHYQDGILTVKKDDMFALDEYLERLIGLHEGPKTEIPVTIRQGTFMSNRMQKFKD